MKTPSVHVPGEARFPRILAYHEVSSQFQLGITAVSPLRFQAHLDFLSAGGLQFIPLRGLSDQIPEASLCLTFDDGYASFMEHVFPVLQDRNLPATLFIPTGYAGQINTWDVTFGVNRRRHLSWELIREIAAAGIEVGSHTVNHADLTKLPSGALRRELEDSKKMLEDKLGVETTSLALPFGAINRAVFSQARSMGYREICGGAPSWRGYFAGVLPRLPVYRMDGAQALRRKIELSLWERSRLLCLQSFSHGTRWLKHR